MKHICPKPDPRRIAALFVRWNGKPLNTALMARHFSVSRPTIVARLQMLQRLRLARVLPFHGGGRRPVLYLHDAYGAGPEAFRSLCIEQITTRLSTLLPESRFSWWRLGRARPIDLLADLGSERIGFIFLPRALPGHRGWKALDTAWRLGVIDRGFLLDRENRARVLGRAVQALPLVSFLEDLRAWILERRAAPDARAARLRLNERRAADFLAQSA